MRSLLLSSVLPLVIGCAQLHHVQIGEIDNRKSSMRKFDIKLSETGINTEEANEVIRSIGRSNRGTEGASQWVEMLQYGPRTGNPVFDPSYPDKMIDLIYQECPSGKVTGLTSIRETRKYPVISGEIVKITGWCIK